MATMDPDKPARARDAQSRFVTTSLPDMLSEHAGSDPAPSALARFRAVAEGVPAYGAFLREHGVEPAAVRTLEDFRRLPLTTRDNYVRRYPLPARCRGGRLEACDVLAVSSGSTGEPTVWPRSVADEFDVAARFEQVFRDAFEADTRSTLAVVCFPLGTWVGGLYTAACCRHLATKGYPVTVVAPGNQKPEIYRVLAQLAPLFEQVVLLGYPPFIKDVVDTGAARGIDWQRLRPRLVLAGEVFSEEWRTLMGERAGLARLPFETAALYGTADAGVLGNETPLSVVIRRFLAARPDAARALFGEARLPTLVQYDPFARYFETHEGTLVFSGDGGAPLVRYHISDRGGIVPYDAMLAALAAHGFDPVAEVRRQGARGVHALPFVYVFGRSHFAVSFYGANVFPEMVAVGLEQPGVAPWVTGRFVMEVVETEARDVRLRVAVELAEGIADDDAMRDAVARSIAEHVARLSSEYAHYVPEPRRVPDVVLYPTGHPEYFPVGVKHRYSR